jgi:cytochrome P450/NADPH-cytochrome P450 reductase
LVATNHPIYAELFAKESEWFTKQVGGTLIELKNFSGNGLFTSNSDDFEWKLAHKLLMPAFSPRAIKVCNNNMDF